MQRWDPLNDRQLALLRRIVDGDDLSGPDGAEHRRSGRALHDRGLVTVTRKGGVWRARPTDAGRFYLEHGHHPDHPDRLAAPGPTGRPTPQGTGAGGPSAGAAAVAGVDGQPSEAGAVSSAAVRLARELIDRLQREDGTFRIESPDDETRARYRRIIHAAKQYGLVPIGCNLRHTGRDAGDIVIRLSAEAEPDDTAWNRIRLNTRRVTTDPALVFAALDADPTNLNVTAESLPRALQLIRLLAAEARKRGHRVGVNTKTKHPRVYLQIGQARRAVTLIEEYDKVRHVPTAQEVRDLRRRPWKTPPEFDTVASGRLRLEIARDGYDKRDTWTDTKRSPLERRLRQVIRDVEASAAADEQARLAYQRAQEEAAAERKRQEEAALARWRAAMADARTRAVDKLRADTFRHAYQAWTAAAEIRAFCTALEQAAANGDLGGAENVARWVAWGRAAADRIDPACGTPSLAEVSYDVEPGPNDLRPFLGEWSPHRPQREYRSERDEQALADARRQAESWHYGMLGRSTWR